MRCNLNLGTTSIVTRTTIPNAPKPTLAARNMSVFVVIDAVIIVLLDNIKSKDVIVEDMEPKFEPVPCVPVCVAPAMDCIAIAPVFFNAYPACNNCSFRSLTNGDRGIIHMY